MGGSAGASAGNQSQDQLEAMANASPNAFVTQSMIDSAKQKIALGNAANNPVSLQDPALKEAEDEQKKAQGANATKFASMVPAGSKPLGYGMSQNMLLGR